MRLRPFLAAGAALAALCAAAPSLAAQSGAAGSATADSARRLGTVEVTAGTKQGGAVARLWRNLGYRSEITALMRESRALARRLGRYDLQIARLEAYRDSLVASRELREHRIAMLDSATAATRAERLRLEAKVRTLEGRGAREVTVP
jgi:hypothetical protein